MCYGVEGARMACIAMLGNVDRGRLRGEASGEVGDGLGDIVGHIARWGLRGVVDVVVVVKGGVVTVCRAMVSQLLSLDRQTEKADGVERAEGVLMMGEGQAYSDEGLVD